MDFFKNLKLIFFYRITKEVYYYEKEVIREKERLLKMQNELKDEHTLKQQVSKLLVSAIIYLVLYKFI